MLGDMIPAAVGRYRLLVTLRRLTYLTIILPVFLVAHGSGAQTRPTPPAAPQFPLLFPVKQEGKFGYIDRSGRVIIQPQYEHAGRFAEGRALVRIQSKPHFIDGAGKVLFSSPFHDDVTFAEGYAGGHVGRDGYRYIDTAGKCINGSFATGRPFREGRAAVGMRRTAEEEKRDPQVNFDGIWFGFIDTTGTLRIPPRYLAVGAFSHGLAPVYVGGINRQCTGLEGGKWGYIDRTGRFAIDAQFDRAEDFSEGVAVVSVGESKGYIDTQGRHVIPLGPRVLAGPFKDGVAFIRDVVGGDYYYINKQGETVLPPEPRFFAFNFSEGFVPSYWVDGGGQGLIDKRGRWLVPPQFDHVGPFEGGLAYVAVDGKFGYVDTQGQFVWKPTN